ncbi:aminopeptidase N-like isoform X2 [Frankliniella occidentalis]|uniref:Aminopeptidase N-like isoform X2 n=1 Tax=Frankliniella occidentalis TaxID=133901 RepID=A0A6J1SS67_FRAOC|nr:aminopeptidase N-like isoform X2 [Frankliniella occidentalis]
MTAAGLRARAGVLLCFAACVLSLPTDGPQVAHVPPGSIGVSTGTSASGVLVISYDVQLRIDDGDTFDTATLMTLEAEEAVDSFEVHAKDIAVDPKISVWGPEHGVSTKIPSTVDIDGEVVHIALTRPLTVGVRYEVTMTATGTVGSPSDGGLVRTTFDKGSWAAVVRGAGRRLFPCVDTPDALADVTLHVDRPTSHVALANADLNKTEDITQASSKDTFETAKLAPHEVRLVVAPLQGALQDPGLTLWARSEAAPFVDRLLSYMSTTSDVVENLSGLPLALQHLAVVALPGLRDAASAAGLVLLDEDVLLGFHPSSPPSAHRDALLCLAEAVAEPAVRGAARPLRWGDAWAARSLAAHLRHRYADQVAGRWRLAEQQMALQMQDVLEAGGWPAGAALPTGDDNTVVSRADVDRGAALLRMFEYAMSPKRFDNAVRNFYQLSAQRAVCVDDLYDALADATYDGADDLPSGVTVPVVMASWTRQPGYPVVTVVRDYEANSMTVSQKAFSWSSDAAQDAEWWLPVSYTYAEEGTRDRTPNATPQAWLVPGENDMSVEMVHLGTFDWVYFNVDQGAPYRVNYDVSNWQMLIKELQGPKYDVKLAPTWRAQLLGDALALARAGELDYALALDLATYLGQEDDAVPWMVARRSFAFLEDHLEGLALESLRQFEALVLKSVYLEAQFQMDGEGEDGAGPDVLLRRELAATWACAAGLQQCLDHADGLYSQWRNQGSQLKRGFAEAVLCRAMSKGDAGTLDVILAALGSSWLVGGERLGYVRAASCASSEALLEKAVQQALSESGPFMASEVGDLLLAVGSRKPAGWALATRYLGNTHQRILHRTGYVGFVRKLSLHLASKVSSQDQLDKLVSAVRAAAGDDAEVLEAAVRQEVAVNLDWAQRHGDEVADWLWVYLGASRSSTTAAPTTTTTTTPSTTVVSASTTPVPAGASAPAAWSWPATAVALLVVSIGRVE